jgi:hypothetical protein
MIIGQSSPAPMALIVFLSLGLIATRRRQAQG